MSPFTSFKYTALATAFALVSVNSAIAAELRSGNIDAMARWYGRAGGPVGADAVHTPQVSQNGGQPLQVSFSEALAEWTNMHRKDATVGPVTDSSGAGSQAAGPIGAATASAEHYGRAGDDELLEELQVPQ